MKRVNVLIIMMMVAMPFLWPASSAGKGETDLWIDHLSAAAHRIGARNRCFGWEIPLQPVGRLYI